MMELNDLPEALSTAVLQFCQENLRYEGSISVHGNVTVVANAHTAVSFFSKKLGGSTVKGEAVDQAASSIDSLAGGLPVDGTANQNPAEDLCFTTIEDTQQYHAAAAASNFVSVRRRGSSPTLGCQSTVSSLRISKITSGNGPVAPPPSETQRGSDNHETTSQIPSQGIETRNQSFDRQFRDENAPARTRRSLRPGNSGKDRDLKEVVTTSTGGATCLNTEIKKLLVARPYSLTNDDGSKEMSQRLDGATISIGGSSGTAPTFHNTTLNKKTTNIHSSLGSERNSNIFDQSEEADRVQCWTVAPESENTHQTRTESLGNEVLDITRIKKEVVEIPEDFFPEENLLAILQRGSEVGLNEFSGTPIGGAGGPGLVGEDLSTVSGESGKNSHSCGVCGKTYVSLVSLVNHKKTHVGEKPFECGTCGKHFSRHWGLINHIRVHQGQKPFKCDKCVKAFSTKSKLKMHWRTHTGERPYKCQECGKGFALSSNLNVHMRTHTGERPHKCDFCGKQFLTTTKLKRHLWSHSDEKPFRCEYCGQGFTQRSHLEEHMRRHSGERPFTCKYCGKGFGASKTLSQHLQTHTGEKPHRCAICGQSFARIAVLHRHMQSHGKDPPYQGSGFV